MNTQLTQAMQNQDNLVVEFLYRDANNNLTRRVVSPIRFLSNGRFLGLCLSREEPRQFYTERCAGMIVQSAADYLMPVPMCGPLDAANAGPGDSSLF